MMFDWHNLKFFESTENVKRLLHSLTGRNISSKLAKDISICLNQGRLFYTSAASSSLEIRPLLIYYGMMAFAKAVAISRALKGAETLPASHGLKAKYGEKMVDVSAKIETTGTFQDFNNAIAPIQKAFYSPISGEEMNSIYTPTVDSSRLMQKECMLKDIFSRIPGLEKLYYSTFQEAPKFLPADGYRIMFNDYIDLTINPTLRPDDKVSLKGFLESLRTSYPFLNKWCFRKYSFSYGAFSMEFSNIDPSTINELAIDAPIEAGRNFQALNVEHGPKLLKLEDIVAPCAGNFQGFNSGFIAPFNELYIAEASYYYIGMFILSSVVRYQPHIWVNAVTGNSYGNTPPDDAILALIEHFLDLSLAEFPMMILSILTEPFPMP